MCCVRSAILILALVVPLYCQVPQSRMPSTSGPVIPIEGLASSHRGATADDARAVAQAVLSTTFLASNAPESVRAQLAEMELAFREGSRPPVQEKSLADALNRLAEDLAVPRYTTTTAEQIRIYRMELLPFVPTLAASVLPPPPNSVIGSDMSPAGAVFIGLQLLNLKATDKSYRIPADQWVKSRMAQRARAGQRQTTAASFEVLPPLPPDTVALMQDIRTIGGQETGRYATALRAFLDSLDSPSEAEK